MCALRGVILVTTLFRYHKSLTKSLEPLTGLWSTILFYFCFKGTVIK